MSIDSETEQVVYATQPEGALPSDTRSGESYLKDYNKVISNASKPTKGPNEQPTKQVQTKQK